MANSIQINTVYTYDLDGVTTQFNVPFEYLSRNFVVVTLVGQDRKVLVNNTDFIFTTASTIRTLKVWGSADGYQYIEVRRETSATDRLVDFQNGSILRATDLNVSSIQSMHIAEEARDLVGTTMGVDLDGNLDARGKRITNVVDGVEPGDV
ncbi:TPA: phage tail fiber protein, partial [Kluyvera georgiana]